jgi:hypothetical protein
VADLNALPTGGAGELTVVGTGIAGPGHASVEARAAIEYSDRCFMLVADPLTEHWLRSFKPDVTDLSDEYVVGRPRTASYEAMVGRILEPVREGMKVCAVFYGHPGVFANPSHEAVRRARGEGYLARMQPAISAEDCLFADLGVDPGVRGCQSFEATDFLVRRRRFDPTAGLILWQTGVIGVSDFRLERLWNREGLAVLSEVLLKTYPPEHRVVIYEASTLPIAGPRVEIAALSDLPRAPVTALSTLWIEPLPDREADVEMMRRLHLV